MRVELDREKLKKYLESKNLTASELSKRIARNKSYVSELIRYRDRKVPDYVESQICEKLEVPEGTFIVSEEEQNEFIESYPKHDDKELIADAIDSLSRSIDRLSRILNGYFKD